MRKVFLDLHQGRRYLADVEPQGGNIWVDEVNPMLKHPYAYNNYIFKDRPLAVYADDGRSFAYHPTITERGRLLRTGEDMYRAEEKTSEEERWGFVASGSAKTLDLTEQEIKWAIDKR